MAFWYREPFCHQIGPYQTLRAEKWSTQLLVRFRVFFEFKKIRNSPKWGIKFQGRVILGKKGPLPGSLQTVVRSGEAPPDGQSIKIQSRFWSKNDFFQKPITPKMLRSKASLNSPFWGLLDFGEGLLRSLTAPKSLTALPIPQSV